MSDMNEIFVKKDRKLIERISAKDSVKNKKLQQIAQLEREIAELDKERESLVLQRQELYNQMPINMYRAYAQAHAQYKAAIRPEERVTADWGKFFEVANTL